MTSGRLGLVVALSVGLLMAPAAAGPPDARPFYMGFTPTEYDATPQALEDTYAFIKEHGDLIAHRFAEGVPWQEAYDRKPYHPSVERNLQYRARKRSPGQKVFLSLSPMTVQAEGLAGYWGAKGNMPRPGPWQRKDFDDPEVITAYTNFCGDMIRRLKPDFMAYGIEVNSLVKEAPNEWPKFVKLARVVYAALKAEHHSLPIFVSLQLDYFWADEARQRKAVGEILPYTDYIAVSSYPYVDRYPDPREIPADFFAASAGLAPKKPFAVAETGFTATPVHARGARIRGREDWQDAYVRRLLADSQRLHAQFVVWFVPRDYDALLERLKTLHVSSSTLDLFGIWKSTGLVNAQGTPRKALETWTDWFKRPRQS